MTIADKLRKLSIVYKNKGRQAEYDAFWDTFQQNGARTGYAYAFYNAWSDDVYNPKYPIIVKTNNTLNSTFAYAKMTDTKVDIQLISPARVGGTFYGSNLVTIRKLIVDEGVTYTADAFMKCSALKNITFEGTIGNTINFQWSPLTKGSIQNIIEHLSPSTSNMTLTLKKSAKEAAFTDDEWAVLIATKPNWTISLV
ncbi:MAG: hypothetical protein IJP38_01910 [Oscillospiraceae bacterium]|nr:hypothetical protein [Oscillospiraceae bacterium]